MQCWFKKNLNCLVFWKSCSIPRHSADGWLTCPNKLLHNDRGRVVGKQGRWVCALTAWDLSQDWFKQKCAYGAQPAISKHHPAPLFLICIVKTSVVYSPSYRAAAVLSALYIIKQQICFFVHAPTCSVTKTPLLHFTVFSKYDPSATARCIL